MLTGWYPAEKLSLMVQFRKAFQQRTIREALRWTKNLVEMFGRNVLSDKNHVFMIVKMNAFGISGGMLS